MKNLKNFIKKKKILVRNSTKSFYFIDLFSLENKTDDDGDTFGARMKLQIIQNLELSIHNIHIVYEDRTTKPNHPFSFGITLDSMSLHVERYLLINKSRISFFEISRQQMHNGFQQLLKKKLQLFIKYDILLKE